MINKTSLALALILATPLVAHANADALDALFSPDYMPPDGEPEKPFSMDGELGLIVTTGNTQTSSLKGAINAHQELPNWSNDYIFEGLVKKDEVQTDEGKTSQTSAQKIFLSGQGNYKLANPDHRLFAFASYEDDRFSGFNYQSTVAGGWAQQLWHDEVTSFSYSVGPGYSFVETDNGEQRNGVIVRGALDFKWRISDNANFRQALSTEVGSNNTKSKSETSVSAKINGSLAMKLSLLLNHNSEVEPGKKNLDTQTAVTLVYTFF